MSRHRQRRQNLEQLPELPAMLRAIYEEIEAEACDTFLRVTDILRFAHEQTTEPQREESRSGTTGARG